ncbi:MAG: methyltransferase domain-containing protein [Candidatus Dadabacteria bacterium]|nr:methyltransferase domain-containing protein [Candidatus Dadabacteria bacterium]NIQ13658.1 methyltransferase domain-containing protein [Candidatus Dadabacteria bacterium]
MSIQSKDELDSWYSQPDPWGYETNPEDLNRCAMLLSVLPQKRFSRILDIGCGNGFVTQRLPGDTIIGVDISENAVKYAQARNLPNVDFQRLSIFDLPEKGWYQYFDLIVISGVLYPQYIGKGHLLVYTIIDDLLKQGGHLACAHILEWYNCRFPYITLTREYYSYREFSHILEIYLKTL